MVVRQGKLDRGKTRRRPVTRLTDSPCCRVVLLLFLFPDLSCARPDAMMVMVVSVLPGGHPRCVPNKPTCWRDNGSTVTTQLLEREGEREVAEDYRESYTHYRQKAIEFEF